MKKLIVLIAVLMVFIACKKDTDNFQNCGTNEGQFNITINSNEYILTNDASTQFSIVYNWFGFEESAFIIDGKDQNGSEIYVELGLPGLFIEGTNSYNNSTLDVDFFDIDVDTLNLYVSEVAFDVTESNLDTQDGLYKPVSASFTGTAHSYPWINGVAPTDNISFSGSFCLNGIVMP